MPKSSIGYFTRLLVGILLISNNCVLGKLSHKHERMNSMLKLNDKIVENWVEHLNKAIAPKNGLLTTQDVLGNEIFIEWEKVDSQTMRINEVIQSMSDILAQTYTTMELEFAEHYPHAVQTEMFLKGLAPFFEEGTAHVDWKSAELLLSNNLKQFFNTTDFTKFSSGNELQIFIFAMDATTKETLGVINFIAMEDYGYGTLKAAFFGTSSSARNRGVEKILMCSAFKLVPEIKRLFLHTRITNKIALDTYRSWGFKNSTGPNDYWQDMEYLIAESDVLQREAQTLQE